MRLVSLLAPLCLLQSSLVVLDSSVWIIVKKREDGHPGSTRGEHDSLWLGAGGSSVEAEVGIAICQPNAGICNMESVSEVLAAVHQKTLVWWGKHSSGRSAWFLLRHPPHSNSCLPPLHSLGAQCLSGTVLGARADQEEPGMANIRVV